MFEYIATVIHPLYALIVVLYGVLLGYLGWRLTGRTQKMRLSSWPSTSMRKA